MSAVLRFPNGDIRMLPASFRNQFEETLALVCAGVPLVQFAFEFGIKSYQGSGTHAEGVQVLLGFCDKIAQTHAGLRQSETYASDVLPA